MEIVVAVVIIAILVLVLIFLLPGLTGAPYVPTKKGDLDRVFTELYPLGKNDLLIDLGAGDGVIMEAVVKHKAKALGLEINPLLALFIRRRFHNEPCAKVKCCNFYRFKFPPETTVVYAFAVSTHIKAILRKLQSEAKRLGKPIYFISNAFDIPDLKPEGKLSSFYLYKIDVV